MYGSGCHLSGCQAGLWSPSTAELCMISVIINVEGERVWLRAVFSENLILSMFGFADRGALSALCGWYGFGISTSCFPLARSTVVPYQRDLGSRAEHGIIVSRQNLERKSTLCVVKIGTNFIFGRFYDSWYLRACKKYIKTQVKTSNSFLHRPIDHSSCISIII